MKRKLEIEKKKNIRKKNAHSLSFLRVVQKYERIEINLTLDASL